MFDTRIRHGFPEHHRIRRAGRKALQRHRIASLLYIYSVPRMRGRSKETTGRSPSWRPSVAPEISEAVLREDILARIRCSRRMIKGLARFVPQDLDDAVVNLFKCRVVDSDAAETFDGADTTVEWSYARILLKGCGSIMPRSSSYRRRSMI